MRRQRLAWALLRGVQLQAHRLLQVRQGLGLQQGLLRQVKLQVRMQKRQAWMQSKMQTF